MQPLVQNHMQTCDTHEVHDLFQYFKHFFIDSLSIILLSITKMVDIPALEPWHIALIVIGSIFVLLFFISLLQQYSSYYSLRGKNIVITGGSSGIGKAIAKVGIFTFMGVYGYRDYSLFRI